MKYAMIFPGQATEIVDPREGLSNFSGAKSVFGFGDRFFQGLYEKSPEELTFTLNQQPGVALHSLAVANALNTEGFQLPDFVSGHSLGTVVSLIYTRVLPDEIGMKTLSSRAQITQKWADKKPGKMAAILGLSYEEISWVCQKFSLLQGKIVVIANYNEPRQIVISGQAKAVDEVSDYLKKYQPKKIIPLPTKVAFHSPLIREASEEFDHVLSEQNFLDPMNKIAVVVDNKIIYHGPKIKGYMQGHMLRPVMWTYAIMNIINKLRIRNFLIVGPGQKMVKMIQRTVKFHKIEGVKVICLSTGEEIEKFLQSPFA